MLSDPKIIAPIPQSRFSETQILDKFQEHLNLECKDLHPEKYTSGIFEKGNLEMVALCLFLTNDETDKELGYRFRFNSWGKGYGTEIARGMKDYFLTRYMLKRWQPMSTRTLVVR